MLSFAPFQKQSIIGYGCLFKGETDVKKRLASLYLNGILWAKFCAVMKAEGNNGNWRGSKVSTICG
jgi:hypothetical protein